MVTQTEKPGGSFDRDDMIGWLTVLLAFSLPVYRPWLTLATSLIMLMWIFGGGLRSRISRLKHHRLSLAIVAFLALNLVSLLWSADASAGLRYVTKYRYLLLVPMLASSLQPFFRRRAAAALEIGAVLSVALSVAILAGFLRLGDAHPGNPTPSMAHLDYTLILALVSLLALIRVLYGRQSTNTRLLWFAGFAVTTAGLLFNIGRSGQLGFLVGLAVLLVHWSRFESTRGVGLALVLGALGVAMIFGFSLPALQRMNDARLELAAVLADEDYESNIGGRVAALHVASHMVRENPLLGTGIGANMPRFREVLDTELPELKPAIYWYRHFHNQYAQLATELGLVGLISLAWIFWELVRGPYRSRELGAVAMVIGAVYLVGFLGEPFFHKQIPLVAFGVLAGMLSATQLDEPGAGDN